MSPVMELLASVGLGSARVDTRLSQRAVVAGEELHGTIEVFGGDVDQAIQHVELRLELRSWLNLDSQPDKVRVKLAERMVQPGFTVRAGQRLSLPFVFPIPEDTPMSFGPSRVDLLTALSVDWAIDPKDQDPIDIQPGPLAERTHQALRLLGFDLSKASLVIWRNGTWRQEVVFRPVDEPPGRGRPHLHPRRTADRDLAGDRSGFPHLPAPWGRRPHWPGLAPRSLPH